MIEISGDRNLDWKLLEVSDKGIEFELIFKEKLEVSQGEIPDKIKLILNIDQFTDEYG